MIAPRGIPGEFQMPVETNGYNSAPAYIASPYSVYHQEYYKPARYHASYNLPDSALPLYPSPTRDPNPSRSLWYSARSVPWYYGYWYYPRYVPTGN